MELSMVEHGILDVYVLPTEVQHYLFMYQCWSKNKTSNPSYFLVTWPEVARPITQKQRCGKWLQNVFTAAFPHHTLTKEMNLGEKRLSSELLSCGGSPLTTWVSWSNTLFHFG